MPKKDEVDFIFGGKAEMAMTSFPKSLFLISYAQARPVSRSVGRTPTRSVVFLALVQAFN